MTKKELIHQLQHHRNPDLTKADVEKVLNDLARIVADELVARNPDLTKADVEKVLNDLARIVAAELVASGAFVLPGIGKLKVADVAAREGRNPLTGEKMDIPAKKRVKFKAAKELADHVNV